MNEEPFPSYRVMLQRVHFSEWTLRLMKALQKASIFLFIRLTLFLPSRPIRVYNCPIAINPLTSLWTCQIADTHRLSLGCILPLNSTSFAHLPIHLNIKTRQHRTLWVWMWWIAPAAEMKVKTASAPSCITWVERPDSRVFPLFAEEIDARSALFLYQCTWELLKGSGKEEESARFKKTGCDGGSEKMSDATSFLVPKSKCFLHFLRKVNQNILNFMF